MQQTQIEADDTDLLIADYLEPDPADPALTAYRLRGSHLPVRQVVRQVATDLRGTREIAQELGVYHRAIDAALAHYQRHQNAFTQIRVRETAPAARRHLPAVPWWLDVLIIVTLGVVCTLLGIWLAIYLR